MKLQNRFSFLLFCLVTVLTSFGQNAPKGLITGMVTDETGGQPLEFATVAVYSVSDSSLVTGGITDLNGNFNLAVNPGKYYLKVQFISYGEQFVNGISITEDNLKYDMNKISLKQSELQLDEVTVQADRTQMELQLDKKVYNIGQDLSNLGGSASDLLANLPSVAVDVDGNVSLRGSENVQILIDGKPSNLVGLSGSGGLQQLQGNLIERVEIITNPSARYDAQGGAGIINIILKKDKAKGFNGSFQVQTGAPANHGASVNVNYRTGWVNWFVNYGVNYRENPGEGYMNNAFLADSGLDSAYLNQNRDRIRRGLSQNFRFGSDIYFNEKNVLTLSASVRDSDDRNTTDLFYEYLNDQKNFLGDRFRTDEEDETDLNWQYALNFTRDFNKRGQKLTFDVQYENSNEVESSIFDDTETLLSQTTALSQRSINDNGEERILIQSDYLQPIGKAGLIETGFRYTYRNIFNDYIVESDSALNGTFEEVLAFTNDFNFDERVTAGYFMFSNKINKISYQVGTRLEHTNLQTFLEQGNQRNTQDYLSLFPSSNVTYAFSQEMSVQASYSRRISRPGFRELNPFTSFSDPRNLYFGNPNLQPQFIDSYELGMLTNKKKSSIYYGVYYRFTDGVVQRIQLEEDGVTTRRPENLAQEKSIGVELNISHEFSPRFRTQSNFNFYNSRTSGSLADGSQSFFAEATTLNARIGNYYTNEKLFDAQLNLWYRAPQNVPQGRSLGIASLDLGISRDVLDKNGTIALNIQDVFNTRKYRGRTDAETFRSASEFQWRRGPTATISFTYRLNQAKERRRGRNGDGQRGGYDEVDGADFSPGS